MPTTSNPDEADLQSFLEAAGASLFDGQDKISAGLETPPRFMIANADLEMKVTLRLDADGRMVLHPISATDLQQGGIDPGVLSNVRINFTATVPEPSKVGIPPVKKPKDVIENIRTRVDMIKIEKVLGKLEYKAIYSSESRRWIVSAQDSQGRLVRETLLPDE